jgi:integrase
MSIHEVSPGKFVVQIFRADPLREEKLRLCKRVAGRDAALKQERTFEAQATEWVARRRLISEARTKGIAIASPSVPSSATSFADFLMQVYLPWARTHLEPRTLEARKGIFVILADDFGNTALADVELRVTALVDRWREQGCRYTVEVDRRGRRLNRKPRPISDAGLNERLKVLKAILTHAHLEARILPVRPRIALVTKKRAAPGAAKPIRYFSAEERVRFLRYSVKGTDDVFEIGRMLGLRPDELFHLLVGSVDFRQRKVWIQASPCACCPDGKWIPKTGSFRGVDICDDLLPILQRLAKGKRDTALLIPSEHGLPHWRRIGGGGRFVRVLRKAGLARKGLSIYSLRHTFAADLVTAGRPMQEVAALLGNSVRVCEMHYGHLMPGRTAEAVQALSAVRPWAASGAPTKEAVSRRRVVLAAVDTSGAPTAPTKAANPTAPDGATEAA